MMIGESAPYVPIPEASPPFPLSSVSVETLADLISGDYSSKTLAAEAAALQYYLPSNGLEAADSNSLFQATGGEDSLDPYSCDEFRMYDFKVRRCSRGRSHDWTECPYAHPGEKARRRDPRRFHYSGTACQEFRKGACRKGDACEFAHGVFECWLHPARYRTQMCKDGTGCRRRVCFFAHTPEQLRVLSQRDSYDGSPLRHAFNPYLSKGSIVSSPTSTLASPPVSPPSESPPMSPHDCSLRGGLQNLNSIGALVSFLRSFQIRHAFGGELNAPAGAFSGFGSPRHSSIRRVCYSPPATRDRSEAFREDDLLCGEGEAGMERVKSGRDLRAEIYAKHRKENSLGGDGGEAQGPDVWWVSELVGTGP